MQKLLVGIVLVLSVLVVPQAAQAAGEKPTSVTPSTVYPGVPPCTGISPAEFTTSGKSFKPREEITLSIGGVEYDPFQADAAGRYTQTLAVQSVPSGTYPVLLRGDAGTYAASTIYIGWSACRSWSRKDVAISGAGFAADDEVKVLLDDQQVATADTDAQGRFDVALGCPKGKHVTKVTGAGGRTLTFAEFTC